MTIKRYPKYPETSVVVTNQGGPIVNGGYIIASGDEIVAIEVDMSSKNCDVLATTQTEDGAPEVWIDGSNALHLKDGMEKEQTQVTFPDFKGWDIFSAHIARYTFRVCLVKDQSQAP